MPTSVLSAESLKHSINTRQLTMIGIGGVIGAGLFVGSGNSDPGPASRWAGSMPSTGA